MATDLSKLFIAPKHDIAFPQVDFGAALGRIGDSIIAARERAPREAFQELLRNAPRRPDGSVDPRVVAGIAAQAGYTGGVTDFSKLGTDEEAQRLAERRFAQSQYEASPEYLRQVAGIEKPLERERFEFTRRQASPEQVAAVERARLGVQQEFAPKVTTIKGAEGEQTVVPTGRPGEFSLPKIIGAPEAPANPFAIRRRGRPQRA
jgi:hypothetical protein